MTTQVRSAVDWTVLAAALSLMGVACNSPTSEPQVFGDTGGTLANSGGSSLGNGGASITTTAKGGSGPGTGGSSSASSSATGGSNSSSTASGGVVSSNGGTSSTGGKVTSSSSSSGGVRSSNGGASSIGGNVSTSTSSGAASSSSGGVSSNAGAHSSGASSNAKGGARSSSGGASTGGASSGTGGPATGGQTGSGVAGANNTNGYNPDFKEFYGEDCTVGTPKDVNDAKLPDLFEFVDGTRMSKKSEWRCRRAELKKIVEKYIHGEKPGTPEKVTGTVSATSIKVHVEHKGKTIDFSVAVSLPGGASGPVPAIIGLGGGSLDASIVKGEGVASINYDMSALADEKTRSGLFTTIYGSTGASAQVGWAWGVSRIIDVLVAERDAGKNNIIDPTAIGVTGCSRLGKGAFTIGAFDERIALGIPQESGTGGVSAFRVVNTAPGGPNGKPAQSLDSAWTEAQGWFGTVFSTYKGKVNTIPGDTHSLVAMYAPRGLLVLDNSRIGELGSVAQHAATAAGGEVYKALGVEKNVEYHGGNATDPHNHCTFYTSQADPLKRAIRAHLTRKAAADGRIAPAAVATADMTKWVDWTAPALE